MAASMHNQDAATSTQVDGVRRRIAVPEIFNHNNLQPLSLSI
jgi:hypothetical protein